MNKTWHVRPRRVYIRAGMENITEVQNKCALYSESEKAEHDKKKKVLGRIYGTWESVAGNVGLAGVRDFQ